MSESEFRAIHMPYCIKRLEDGRYIVLNRNYKPIGFSKEEYVNCEDSPAAVKFKGLTSKVALRISYRGSDDLTDIYLYGDGCVPTESKANMDAYLERLRVLSKLKIE